MALSAPTMFLVMSKRGGWEDVLGSSPSKSDPTADSASSLSLSVMDSTGEITSESEHDSKRVLGSEHSGISAAESDYTALIASSSIIL